MRNPEREFTPELKWQIKAEQGFKCGVCNKRLHLSVHHILPMSMGGSGERENGVGVCQKCHQRLDQRAVTQHKFYPEGIFWDRVEDHVYKVYARLSNL